MEGGRGAIRDPVIFFGRVQRCRGLSSGYFRYWSSLSSSSQQRGTKADKPMASSEREGYHGESSENEGEGVMKQRGAGVRYLEEWHEELIVQSGPYDREPGDPLSASALDSAALLGHADSGRPLKSHDQTPSRREVRAHGVRRPQPKPKRWARPGGSVPRHATEDTAVQVPQAEREMIT